MFQIDYSSRKLHQSLPVVFTIFTSHSSPLSKKYDLNREGKIVKTPAAQMYSGTAMRKEIDFSDFPNELAGAHHYIALGYGAYDKKCGSSVSIVTANKVSKSNDAIARTRDFFNFADGPGILLLDYDPSDRGKAIKSPEHMMEILAEVDSQFATVAHCARSSLSASVHKLAERPAERSGFHLYIPIKQASDIPRTGTVLFKKLWLAGCGHIDISKSGSLLPRTIMDAAVFSPERLDFVGKPIIMDPGLMWAEPVCLYKSGDYLDSRNIKDLTTDEELAYAQLVATAKEKASSAAKIISSGWKSQKINELIEKNVPAEIAEQQIHNIVVDDEKTILPLDFVLQFDGLGRVSVSDVLANPIFYDKKTLADPFEPEKGPRKAKFWLNAPDGMPFINSFVQGGVKYYFPTISKLNSRAEIQLVRGKKPAIVDACEEVLIKAAEIYTYGGTLVRLIPYTSSDEITRLHIEPVEPVFLVDHLMQNAKFVKYQSKEKAWVECDLPQDYAITLLARKAWKLPHLNGVIYAPTLRPDGSILDMPGYDKQTRLFADFNAKEFLPVPITPTKSDVIAAINTLTEPLKGFSFEKEFDKATAVAAILTALVRKSINNAPMFLFNSPKMGAGKGLLVDAVSLIATGRLCAPMSQTANSDEERKRLFAFLSYGAPIFCMDNIEKHLEGETLCTVLTMAEFTDRILCKTQIATVPTKATFLATGNGVTVVGDLVRRVLSCNTDPQVEDPHERYFDVHLPTFVTEHRAELVRAALTLLRAYHVAGRPKQNLKSFGSFEQWSDWIRSALVWSGFDDPCKSLARWKQIDPVRTDLVFVLEQWHAVLGADSYTVERLVDFAQTAKCNSLKNALLDIAGHGGEINRRTLGRWLVRYTNRIEGGYRLELAGHSGTRNKYCVVTV